MANGNFMIVVRYSNPVKVAIGHRPKAMVQEQKKKKQTQKQQTKTQHTMKKLALTIAIVLGLGMISFAQGRMSNNEGATTEGTGLFGLGVSFFNRDGDVTLFTDYGEYEEEEELENGDFWYSQGGNGLFGLGVGLFNNREGGFAFPGLPGFDSEDDEDAPLGCGIALLAGLSAAYLVAKRRKED